MKKLSLIIFVYGFILMNQICAQDKSVEVQNAIDTKDYSTALVAIKRLVEENRANDAIKFLIKLQTAGYNDKEVLELLGDSYSILGIGELALQNYQDAENLDSMDVRLKFKSAEELYKQKRYTEAVNKFLKIISIDPQNPKPYLEAAQIFYLAKLYADASVMYEKYLAIEQTKEAYESITKALLETKNYEKTFQFAKEGIEKYPGDVKILQPAAFV